MVIKVHISLFVVLLYNLYFTKKKIFFIAYLFIIMHEFSHMIMALLLHVDIYEIILMPFGVTAKYKGSIAAKQELIITLIGPLASLYFAYFYHNDTYFTVNMIIAIFNLIPIIPLDGGRIVKIILCKFFGKKCGMRISRGISNFAIVILLITALLVAWNFHRYELLLVSTFILNLYMNEIKKEKILSAINYLQIDK